jgi:voltage-gated potassium channel
MKKLLIYSAYFLKNSPKYHRTKKFFYNLLENPNSKLKAYFDFIMIFFVTTSIFIIIYDTHKELTNLDKKFEICIVTVFILEYLLRGWIYNDSHKLIIDYHQKSEYLNTPFKVSEVLKIVLAKKLAYIFSPIAVIDLLAIFPSFRPFWFLRVFLIFRIFKLFRYYRNIHLFSAVLNSRRFELITLIIFMGFLVFVASIAMYLFEYKAPSSQIETLYDSVYWAIVTISTVGYGDISPHTVGGRLVAMVLILSGLGVLSFFVSIIVNAFSEQMHILHENKTYSELERYKDFVIICGFGRVGQEIAWQLKKDRQHFIVIDKELDRIELAKQHDFLTIHDDAGKNKVLLNAGINRGATTVVCTTGDDVDNVYITLSSRYLNPNIRIISRVNEHKNVKKMEQAGADHIIQPFQIAGLLAAEYVGQPVAVEAILGILQECKHVVMDTIVVYEGSFLEGKKIMDVKIEQYKLTLVGIISRNELHHQHRNRYQVKQQHFYFNPEPHFECQNGDIWVVLGRKVSIEHFRKQAVQSKQKGSATRPLN